MPGQAKPVRSTRSLDVSVCPAMTGIPAQIHFLPNWDFVRAKKTQKPSEAIASLNFVIEVEHFAHKIREMEEMLFVFYWKRVVPHPSTDLKKNVQPFLMTLQTFNHLCCFKATVIVFEFNSLAIKNRGTKTTSCILSNGLTQHQNELLWTIMKGKLIVRPS